MPGGFPGAPDHNVAQVVRGLFPTCICGIVVLRSLRFGHQVHRPHGLPHAPSHVANVVGYSDNFISSRILYLAGPEMLPDWVLVFEELFGKCFVNYRDAARGRSIVLGNRTPRMILAPMVSMKPGVTVAWPAPLSSLGEGNSDVYFGSGISVCFEAHPTLGTDPQNIRFEGM